MTRVERRLRRQIEALGRAVPGMEGLTRPLLEDRMRLVRMPIGLLLLCGGLLWFLPILGLWMLPLGLLVLAVDLPVLRPPVTAAVIRIRRRLRRWRRRLSAT